MGEAGHACHRVRQNFWASSISSAKQDTAKDRGPQVQSGAMLLVARGISEYHLRHQRGGDGERCKNWRSSGVRQRGTATFIRSISVWGLGKLSHSCAVLSEEPVKIRRPSGENTAQLMRAVWPTNATEVESLTSLKWFLSRVKIANRLPSRSQSVASGKSEAVSIRPPSAENTALLVHAPVSSVARSKPFWSQSRAVWSPEAVRMLFPSGEKTAETTTFPWCRIATG